MLINIDINMSIVIDIHLEMVEKQIATILNAMCIFQFCFNIIFYYLAYFVYRIKRHGEI